MAFKIGDLFVKLGLQKDGFDKGLNDAKQQTTAFGSSIKAIGGAIAGAFAAGAIINFGKEVFQIATQAEGVKKAFSQIGTENDLENLRSSVKGTVSDLELMKRSVMASNFKIPIQELGKLFEFAAKRSQDTGQSVDYLVDSIVMGIGRKSPLILDNLGISAVQLREKLHGVGLESASVADITRAVGEIASDALARTGGLADTLGTKVQSLGASWENFKLTLSSIFSESGFLKQMLDGATSMLQAWSSKNSDILTKILATLSPDAMIKSVFKTKMLIENFAASVKKTTNELPEVNVFGKKPDLRTAVEKLAALRKINDELEAQRILTQNINRGGAMSEITPIGTPSSIANEPIEFSAVFGNLDSSYEFTKNKFNKFTEEFNADALQFTEELNSIIQSGMINAIESFASGLTELAMGEISGKEFGAQVLAMVGNFMIQLGTAFIVFSKLFIAFQDSIASMNPYAALGIGVALIGAGAAISTVAKKGMSGGGVSASAASGYKPSSSSSAVSALNGNVVFELQGTTLRGVLNNQDRKNSLIR